jgi:cell division protein ftsQ, putative
MKNRALVRNLLLLLLSVALIGGIAYLLIRSPRVTSTDRCEAITVEVKTEAGGEPLFLTGDRITDELARRGIQLRGKRLDSIDLRKIERTLLSMPIYKRAEAFIAPSSSSVQIRLTEKHPLYIVQEASGKSYYVTQGKGTITVNPTFAAYLPIVSGAVDLKMATGPVYDLMAALREDPYFNDYFGQVYVDETDGIVLIPRIGTTRVIMGRESNWSEKLRKWRIFAESVLPKRGMNAFSYVNLDYGTQIIARSRYAPEGETFDEEGEVVTAPTPEPAPAPAPKPTPAATPVAPAPKKPATTEKPREKAKEAPKDKPKDKPASKPSDKAKTDKKEPKKDPKKPAPHQAPTPKKPNKPAEKGKPNKPQKK